MAWWDQLWGLPTYTQPPVPWSYTDTLPTYTQPPVPWSYTDTLPTYTKPWVPDYFNPPKGDFDWQEGLPADVVQRNMPKSSVTYGQGLADQIRQSIALSNPPVAPPVPPAMPNIRGPMQATDPRAIAPQMSVERFGIPSPTRETTSGPVPPPFPSTPPLNADRASRAPMGVFDPRNTAASVGTVPVGQLNTTFSPDEFKHRLITRGEASAPDATSPKGAKGIAQFMDATWDHVGKMMGRPADAPGPYDKTEALLRYNYYMDHLLKKYGGNQVDVAVAYNAGEGFANKWIAAGRPQNMLPGETKRYIANIFGGRTTQYASSSPTPSPETPIRAPATAPTPAEQAPQRPGFDWSANANLWPMLMQFGSAMMQPSQLGFGGQLAQGMQAASQAAMTAQDRDLKRQLLKAQVGEAQSKASMRDWAKAIYADTSIPTPIRMAALFKPEAIPELMKDLDPATQAKLAQYRAMSEGLKTRAETQAKMEASKEATREGTLQSATLVTQAIDKALKQSESGWTTGFVGAGLKQIPGTAARDLAATVETIKANVGFDKLQAMRQASPTGGALGQVSDFENRLLQSVVANLETSQTKEQFRENLMKVKRIYTDIIHRGIKPGEEGRYLAPTPQLSDPLGLR